jgi:hypothetical protein
LVIILIKLGYKQVGKEAEKAINVFYYLTYEDMVDLDKIEDPLLKSSMITQISNYGVIKFNYYRYVLHNYSKVNLILN